MILLSCVMAKRINWHFLLMYIMTGPTARNIKRKVFTSGKPVLWLQKGEYKGKAVNNAMRCPPRKETSNEFHKWGQSVEGMEEILRKFVFPGTVVCDPFLGGGSTALAALALGCKFIGSDIDADCIKTTKGRIAHATG